MAVYRNNARSIAERLILLREYIHENATSTHVIQASDMLAFLENKEHKIKNKTLYSDIYALETLFDDVKLIYDEHKHGYLLTKPRYEAYDLRLIVNSIQAAQFITQEEADRLTGKMIGLADKYTKTSLDRRTFVVNRTRTMNNDLMKKLDTVYEAIAQDRKISYKYHPHNSDTPAKIDGSTTIIASPAGVVWTGNGYEFIAARKMQNKISTYFLPLDWIKQVKILEEKRDNVSTAREFYKNLQKIYDEGKDDDWETKLKVSNTHALAVAKNFGHEATIEPLGTNYFIATIHTYPTPELYMWALSFDPRIEIIDPPDAEDELRGYFSDLANGEFVPPPYP